MTGIDNSRQAAPKARITLVPVESASCLETLCMCSPEWSSLGSRGDSAPDLLVDDEAIGGAIHLPPLLVALRALLEVGGRLRAELPLRLLLLSLVPALRPLPLVPALLLLLQMHQRPLHRCLHEPVSHASAVFTRAAPMPTDWTESEQAGRR